MEHLLSRERRFPPSAKADGIQRRRPMTLGPLIFLTYDDVQSLLDPATVINIAEETLREHAENRVDWCDPRQMTLKSATYPDLTLKYKGCFLPGLGIAGSRVVGLNRTPGGKAVAQARPTKFVLLTDPETGAFLAIIDESGTYALRTGAGVAIAAKYLGQPDCQALGMLGAGDMAEASLIALAEVCHPKEVRVYSRQAANRERYASLMGSRLGLRVVPVERAEDAVRGCQIICSATTATEPFVSDQWLEPGSLIYTMGEFQELETAAYLNTDKLVVDDWEQVKIKVDIKTMLARGEIDDSSVYADLATIVAGRKPGRVDANERIMVRSQGLVTQDVAIGWWVYRAALERGVGQRLMG
jgi:ornithine cyclodeaminase/alanine dehydrogenase-like protein (mu-crystallin family)